jgi:hypothetical protein
MKTYDVYFNDSENSNNKGFKLSIEQCQDYINRYNGTTDGYFADYKNGYVSIICNETDEVVFEEPIR